ncbi:single-stranded DNA-binding protein [Microbispora triticiradicis]|uniref:single-stranded DNA-binding protein n=1 Tax=Microbispora TaxID=2005 RepID=UPI001ABFA75F|nr:MULTISPECIES: single-stranded DNA-binding protein [Microbispora]
MHRNEVVLAGRLSMEPAHRELPSGTLLTQWRLAVRRPGGGPGYQRSDAIECATFDDEVRDSVTGWRLDDLVEVEGALRRRWWRGRSRYEIEVRTARRLQPAPPRNRSRTGGSRARRPGLGIPAQVSNQLPPVPEPGPMVQAREPSVTAAVRPDPVAGPRDPTAGTGASGPEPADGAGVSRRRRSA